MAHAPTGTHTRTRPRSHTAPLRCSGGRWRGRRRREGRVQHPHWACGGLARRRAPRERACAGAGGRARDRRRRVRDAPRRLRRPAQRLRRTRVPGRGKGTRRVQLVRRDGRDVSTLYGREGGGGGTADWRAHWDPRASRRAGGRAPSRGSAPCALMARASRRRRCPTAEATAKRRAASAGAAQGSRRRSPMRRGAGTAAQTTRAARPRPRARRAR